VRSPTIPAWFKTIEREANEFAAELLAPRRLVAPILTRGAISLAKAQELADHFDISLTAGARRVVESSGQPAAMVVCQNGRVSWSLRRNGFPYGLPEKGDALPEGTVAAAAWAGYGAALDPEDSEAFRWLPGADDEAYSLSLLESAVRLGDTGQLLVLLWMPDAE
jgi:hypothetical protein